MILQPIVPTASRSRAPRRRGLRSRADPGHPAFRIADSPFYLIARTAGRYALEMETALRRIGMDLLSWRALMIVHERNPSSVSEIAERAVVRLSTMTRVVQRLQRRGLARVAPRPGDARVTEVHLTAAGGLAVERVRAIASRIYRLAFQDFSEAELAALNALLRRVFANLALEPAVQPGRPARAVLRYGAAGGAASLPVRKLP